MGEIYIGVRRGRKEAARDRCERKPQVSPVDFRVHPLYFGKAGRGGGVASATRWRIRFGPALLKSDVIVASFLGLFESYFAR